MNADRFWTASLRAAPWGATITRVLAAAIAAVEPAAAVRRVLRRTGDTLTIGAQPYDLARYERVLLVGVGKAGAPMAQAAAEVLGARLTAGVVVVKSEAQAPTTAHNEQTAYPFSSAPLPSWMVIEAGHPLPDERSVQAGQQVAALLAQTTPRDLVLALISGGGSALLTLPVPGVALADLQRLTTLLLRCGATIGEINALRKHLDAVKGGGLARLAHPATLATLVLSDVVGNPLDVIASGPTVPDSSTFADAWAVLERYEITADVPEPIRAHLQRGLTGATADTPKVGDTLFAQVQNVIIGSNAQAADAAIAAARAARLHTLLLSTYVQGEAREVGRVLAAIAREAATSGNPLPRPCCIVLGGETTVTLRGDGRGGRNQELALAAVADLAGLGDVALVALATDGGDGPTDAAGAVVTGATLQRAAVLGLDPAEYLRRNDAYAFFAALGDLLKPGSTQTNVNDLGFVFVF